MLAVSSCPSILVPIVNKFRQPFQDKKEKVTKKDCGVFVSYKFAVIIILVPEVGSYFRQKV